ncbi:MAG: MATE family efflux transporter [Planctomycetes bacterium]|nr:MATE family efflux transporter [Planctomycetota bacterium]
MQVPSELRSLLRLAAPILLVQLGQFAMAFVDAAMVGRVSQQALAGIALGNMLVWGLFVFGQGVLAVLDARVAHALGRGDGARARATIQQGLALASFVSLPLMGIGFFAEPIFRALDQPNDVLPLAVDYARWAVPSLLPALLFVALRQSLQAMTTVRPIVVAVLLTNLLNFALDAWLIFGGLGLPPLGVEGAAIATLVSRIAMTVLLAAIAWPLLRPLLRPFDWRMATPRTLLPLALAGLPVGCQYALELGAFSGSTTFLGWIGSEAQAAHTVALKLATASFMVPLSISLAAAVRVGHALGRGDAPAARRAGLAAIVAGAVVMAGFGLAFLLLPQALARTITDVAAVVTAAATLTMIAGVFQVFDGIQVVCVGVLRGLGDTRTPFFVNVLGFWVLGIPVGLLLAFPAGLGAAGFWWGLVLGLATVAAILGLRVRRLFAAHRT